MSMNTNIYGLFPIRIGAFGPVRHTITPSIGYSYRPDFSKPFFGHDFGYFETISDTAGNPLIYDRFRGTPQNESKSMTMSLRNIFETKWGEEGNEKRVKLLNWNMNTRYNFAAEEFHLANLSSSFSSRIGNILNIRVSMTHDFYEFDTENKERLPSFRTSRIPMDNGRYVYLPQPRLINASFNTGFSFSGKRWSPILQDSEPDTVAIDTTQSADEDMFQGDLSSRAQRISRMSGGQLWRASFTVNYSLNKSNPDNEIKNFWLSANSSFNITKTWKLAYTARFNMIDTELISSRFSIEKDLHCWELSFNWTPTGPGAGYYLKINVKSPNLRDIKIEEKGGVHRTRYGF